MYKNIHFYNSLKKKKENFFEVTGKKLGDTVLMYNCGPTVYSNAHIGNLSAYIMADLIRRFLDKDYFGEYKVIQAKNITDVGHLINDADDGEDKLDVQARKEKKDPLEIAKYYEELYLEDEKKLNLIEPEFRPRATETIKEMIETIEKLEKNGYTYELDDGVYFDVNKFEKYGELSGNTLDKIRDGVRIEVNEQKKSPADFALWKKLIGVNENHILNWDSPWGKGFPGWHIECSAMATKHLGSVIDIHTGGEDNIFPHHECEIAQSCGASGEDIFSHFWIHKRHVQVEGETMSKSKGNFYTLKDLEDKGINPLDFRLLILMSHYRTRTNFTFNGVNAARKFREKFNRFYSMLNFYSTEGFPDGENTMKKQLEDSFKKQKLNIIKALCDDLNTPKMFAELNKMLSVTWHDVEIQSLSKDLAKDYKDYIEKIDKVLGILEEPIPSHIEISRIMREEARKNKDWAKSDELRDDLRKQGYVVEDGPLGSTLKRVN